MNIQSITKQTKTRYLKRTNTIKSSNFSMNLDTLDAYSYDWWLFCTKVNGKVIFNHTTYSPTTIKHQYKALRVLDYKYDLKLKYTRKSLSNLNLALECEIKGAQYEIKELIKAIRRPRTHKAKNNERRDEIKKLLKHITNVRTIKRGL